MTLARDRANGSGEIVPDLGDSAKDEARQWVLVAEDDDEMRILIAQVLRRDGFSVLEVNNGIELQRMMEHLCTHETPPVMVISDIRMPGLTGLDVLGTIREWGLTLPVIIITAFADEDTLVCADYLGATAVLDKPFDMDELRDAVQFLTRYPFSAANRGSR